MNQDHWFAKYQEAERAHVARIKRIRRGQQVMIGIALAAIFVPILISIIIVFLRK